MITECILIRWNHRKIAAFPQSISYRRRLQLVSLLPADTWRKWLINRVILRLPLLLIPPRFRQKVQAVSLFAAWNKLIAVDQKLERSSLYRPAWMIQWPSLEYRKRIYLYSHDETEQRSYFAKFSFGSPDTERLCNERRALSLLSERPDFTFQLPTLISTAVIDSCELLVFEAFESDSKPIEKTRPGFPETWIESFRGDSDEVTINDVQVLDWWSEFTGASGALTNLRQFLASCRQETIGLASIHGDLGPGNVRVLPNGSHCIYDWENFTTKGPAETDRLHYWIALQHRRCLKNPESVLSELIEFSRQQAISPLDLAMALAFLISKDSLAALCLGEQWKQMNFILRGCEKRAYPFLPPRVVPHILKKLCMTTFNMSLADSIIYIIARKFGAMIWTRDSDFRELLGVRYFPSCF